MVEQGSGTTHTIYLRAPTTPGACHGVFRHGQIVCSRTSGSGEVRDRHRRHSRHTVGGAPCTDPRDGRVAAFGGYLGPHVLEFFGTKPPIAGFSPNLVNCY